MHPMLYNLGGHGDDAYAELIALHEGLDETGSAELNARLVLTLMNALGDLGAIRAAFRAATDRGIPPGAGPAPGA